MQYDSGLVIVKDYECAGADEKNAGRRNTCEERRKEKGGSRKEKRETGTKRGE